VDREIECHPGIAACELRQQTWKEIIARADYGDIEGTAGDTLELAHRFVLLLELLKDRAAELQHFGAGRRQVDFLPKLFEKRQPRVLFELSNLRGDRRLRQMKLLCGT